MKIRLKLITATTWLAAAIIAPAQEVTIPDPGLNAAVRTALQKPTGPLTEQDMLGLTNLDASRRNIVSISGLEAARNLVSLNLQINRLTDFTLPTELTNLAVLDLSLNILTNCTIPSGHDRLASLTVEGNSLTSLSLPPGLTSLTNLSVQNNDLTQFDLPEDLTKLSTLFLRFNLLTNFVFPAGMTNLAVFDLGDNLLTNYTLPPGLTGLKQLFLAENQLASFEVPPGMTNLFQLDLSVNQLTNLVLPGDLNALSELDLNFNQLSTIDYLANLRHLRTLLLLSNQLTDFNLPPDLRELVQIDLAENRLTEVHLPDGLGQLTYLRISSNTNLANLALPSGMTNLLGVYLRYNQLTNLSLPSDLNHLQDLDVIGNHLASLALPAGLTGLSDLLLANNQLTSLTLPPDVTTLLSLVVNGNLLTNVVISEMMAANLPVTIAELQNEGVSVFTYPLTVQLVRPQPLAGALEFGLTGPPGVYAILASTNLSAWAQIGLVSNALGGINFVDTQAHLFPERFYRAQGFTSPTNMVFVRPGTFTMGSPVDEAERSVDEGPQTQVTLTRGFWIGKFEVTQGEYVSLVNTNPSFFPGDLSRPISSVSWPDATNYCWLLTQRELAAGRIPPGSYYRLPTEAEWEYAARAGTTTRFSYGDDPGDLSLTNYAWFASNAGLTVHPVGQKLPNPWGLYDTEGNVWEWCSDWYGPLPGGNQLDPTGPPGPGQQGLKVMRGGAYDYFTNDCRSARRLFFSFPFNTDTDLGFRVVLIIASE